MAPCGAARYTKLPAVRRWPGSPSKTALPLLLAAALTACGSHPKQPDASPPYRTEVTLSSLECDVVMWRRIFVRDENSIVVAEADSGPPLGDSSSGCVVRFVVQLPKAKSYVLDNGTRRSSPVSFDELKAKRFAMEVRLR